MRAPPPPLRKCFNSGVFRPLSDSGFRQQFAKIVCAPPPPPNGQMLMLHVCMPIHTCNTCIFRCVLCTREITNSQKFEEKTNKQYFFVREKWQTIRNFDVGAKSWWGSGDRGQHSRKILEVRAFIKMNRFNTYSVEIYTSFNILATILSKIRWANCYLAGG